MISQIVCFGCVTQSGRRRRRRRKPWHSSV